MERVWGVEREGWRAGSVINTLGGEHPHQSPPVILCSVKPVNDEHISYTLAISRKSIEAVHIAPAGESNDICDEASRDGSCQKGW